MNAARLFEVHPLDRRTKPSAARATSGEWNAPETRSLIARRAPSRSASTQASSTDGVSPEITSWPGQL